VFKLLKSKKFVLVMVCLLALALIAGCGAQPKKEEAKKENNKLISTIKFKAINTSNKGFSIIRIHINMFQCFF